MDRQRERERVHKCRWVDRQIKGYGAATTSLRPALKAGLLQGAAKLAWPRRLVGSCSEPSEQGEGEIFFGRRSFMAGARRFRQAHHFRKIDR